MRPGDIDRLFGGHVPPDDPELGPLARVLAEFRSASETAPTSQVRARHLAAMSEVAVETTVELPARAKPRRRLGFVPKVAAATAGVVLIAGSAMAATGTLPGPAQDAVANVARRVGLDLPGGAEKPTPSAPAPASEGKAKAEQNRTEAEQYTDAKKAWTECVAEKAPAHEGPGPFDPEAACGPKPTREPAQQAPGQRDDGTQGPPDSQGSGQGGGPPADRGPDQEKQKKNQGRGQSSEHGPGAPKSER